ncbi:hypothetical protein D6T64_14260 [Cryobacterium melibiosiphilum]|uniref:Uncharacterized protein n=1 Tax=Cryobacterium melibiosiphilum TaxID=995039 RepID=A0A3A5MPP0_9MICO|nr:hypothetical protein [Cryobacterium melibiosiphilum]RJT87474.1 hypothetical protein D6T64_14260 [Cryobacterium melibiosiphilum]
MSRRIRPPLRPHTDHTVDTVLADQNGLGGRHLGLGLTLSGACVALFLLGRFIQEWSEQPVPPASIAAWLLLIALGVLTHTTARRLATAMPSWLFSAVLAGSALIVALDLAGCWGLAGQGIFPTAAPAVGALLMSLVTLRAARQVLLAAVGLGAALTVAVLAEDRAAHPLTLAPGILTIALAVIPPFVGVAVARAFRRMVTRELDLVLVQSTVSQPRFAVGMLASEQLARLDLDAETLLDDVAQARTPLPLAPHTANTAASLATQLRLHLIEGRTETWLHHAVTESEFLDPAVTLIDPTGLAGLLSPSQRDALLLTIWLLVGDTVGATTVKLTLGPIAPLHGVTTYQKVRFPIELTTTGVRRRRVDPETWQAIRMVGPHVDSNREGSLRVDIECSVDNPADA